VSKLIEDSSQKKYKWQCMKKCTTPLATAEIQIKTTLRFHVTPVRMVSIKKITSAGKDAGERNPYTLL
jgi:hypothetical protein